MPHDLDARLADYIAPDHPRAGALNIPAYTPLDHEADGPSLRMTIRRGGKVIVHEDPDAAPTTPSKPVWGKAIQGVDKRSLCQGLVGTRQRVMDSAAKMGIDLHSRTSKYMGAAMGSIGTAAMAASVMTMSPQELIAPVTTASAASSEQGTSAAEQEKLDEELAAMSARILAGEHRGTVVLDLGHGTYRKTGKDGVTREIGDIGASFHNETTGKTVHESDVTAAMGARMAIELIRRGMHVEFTRAVDPENPHLQDLSDTQRRVLAQFNHAPAVLPTQYNHRVETARDARTKDPRTLYLVLHADKASSAQPRGGAVYIHPNTSVESASYRLAKTLQEQFHNDNLSRNQERGIIPGQDGFGALFTDDCEPEIGLGTRRVGIISPKPVGTIREGVGDIPTVLFEMGFLSNASDVWRLTSERWANNLARKTVDGIDTFFAREYEGRKKPEAEKISFQGKDAYILPQDPAASARITQKMTDDLPNAKVPTTSIVTRPTTLCRPNGVKYTARIAHYGTIPAPSKPATTELAAKGPKSPKDHATRETGPDGKGRS